MGTVLAMRSFVPALLVALLLTGCQSAVQKLSGATPPAPVTFSAEQLASPKMQVEIASRGAQALLLRVAVNQDVETWLAADNISLSFRQGVLVASRGLGFDLMGADVNGTLAALQGQGVPVYRRQMRFLSGDHRTTYLMAGCSLAVAEGETGGQTGSEMVAGRQTRRLEEHCQAHRHEITNLFWVDGAGRILRSRQWVSPEIGYIEAQMQAG